MDTSFDSWSEERENISLPFEQYLRGNDGAAVCECLGGIVG